MQKQKSYYIIDFDSTLIQVEALDELAKISLRGRKDAAQRLSKIQRLTQLGMLGKISIERSLTDRLKLLDANKRHVQELAALLIKKITPSFQRNRNFLAKYANNIFIVTNGFSEYVLPVIRHLKLLPKNVFANSFRYDKAGKIVGLDTRNPLSKARGKVHVLEQLKLPGEVYVIGDGFTDFQMTESGMVTEFSAFTENVARPSVMQKAQRIVRSLDEFLYARRLPMQHSYPKSKMKVLLLENVHPLAAEAFEKQGFAVETVREALSERALLKKIQDVSIVGIRSKTSLTAKAIEQAERLLAVGAFCIGTDQIALNSCSQLGVPVFNAPYSNTRSVVELVLGEIIVLLRRAFEGSRALHKGEWLKSSLGCYEVRGKKLGIVGYGNIGAQLSVLAEALGMEVYYYDIVERLALGKAEKCRSLEELLRKVDIVSLHVDGRASNQNLISRREFSLMRPGVIFMNFSRGKVVDIDALVRAVKAGRVAGAGLDVFPLEPKGATEKFKSALCGLPNVILTPHIGGSTLEAQRNIAEFVTSRLLDYVNNGSSYGGVNFPQIQAPTLHFAHRLLHIHKNVPGILAQINSVLAGNRINILGQYLKTNDQIGYVITDVNKKYNRSVADDLRAIPNTIKFRVLY